MITLIAMPGLPEMGIILFAVLLLFGGRKIPQLMRGLGQGIGEFRRAKKEINDAIEDGQKMINDEF